MDFGGLSRPQLLGDISEPVLVATLVTLVVSLILIILHEPIKTLVPAREDDVAVQASHVGDPVRLGGVAIYAGITAAALIAVWHDPGLKLMLLVTAVPVLAAGLKEDLGFGMSAQRRLAAALVSAALAVLLLETWVDHANLPLLNQVVEITFLGVLLTTILSAGFCHATNLIDGMNGLAALFMMSAAVALAILCYSEGERDLFIIASILAATVFGFFVLNWPFGKIFLGDAGSYGLGHLLIWVAILLADRAGGVAAPALLLVLFWPFADMIHSIVRRFLEGKPVFGADRMHLHQKVRRAIEIIWLGGAHRKRSNPIATLLLAPLVLAPIIVGLELSHNARAAWLALIVFFALFALTHISVTWMVKRHRRKLRSA